jgi:hypothetical protein
MTPPALAETIVRHFKPSGRVLDPVRGDAAFFDALKAVSVPAATLTEWRGQPHSANVSRHYANANGWSMPSDPSPAPSRCSPILAATRIASLLPTAADSSRGDEVSFTWKDY